MTNLVPVGRALLSVSDKSGLLDLARALADLEVELISTGGTAAALRAAGLKVRDVAEVTGFPEMMDGRVKTLHPMVHGGLLALRDDDEHLVAMAAHGIEPIDLLVVNLYPFEAAVARGASYDDCIENIDIGGPAMIRAAAKNHRFVNVVTDTADYKALLDELRAHDGATRLSFRQKLALTAYARTAAYDTAVSTWMAGALKAEAPRRRSFAGTLAQTMRYGENPHQKAAFYTDGSARPGVATAKQCRARSFPTTTSTTPTRPSSWWPSSTRPRARPASSSSTPTPAAWPGARHWPKPMPAPSTATASRPSAASSR